jgi:hypothetical protein
MSFTYVLKAVAEHLLRQGKLKSALAFCKVRILAASHLSNNTSPMHTQRNVVIIEHAHVRGTCNSAAERDFQESGTEMPLSMREPFEQLSAIIQDLRQRRIQFALQYASIVTIVPSLCRCL